MATQTELLDMLATHQLRALREATEEMQPADLAGLFTDMDEEKRLVVFRLLKKEVAAEAFSYMDPEIRSDIVERFSDAELTAALEEMSLDDAADMLEEMPASVVKRILEKSSKSTRENLNRLLNYPADSAGSLMTPEYVRLRRDMTAEEALTEIRRVGEKAETIYTLYVVDRNRLLGIVTARDLLLSAPEVPLTDIMDENVISVQVTDDREFVAQEMSRYDFVAMPVVDSEGMLVGIVTVDDAMDVMTEEATEDIEKMNAMMPSEDSYFNTSVLDHAKHRIGWLLFLMLSSTLTGSIINRYEAAFAAVPLLVGFIPMLTDTGGNCGSQSSTLIIRGLALGEIHPRDALRVLWKEVRVAFICSFILAAVNGLRIYLVYKNGMVAVLVAISLVATILMAKVIGAMLPLGAKRLGFDPALMASPLITTVVDTCSVLIYFNIAVHLFSITI